MAAHDLGYSKAFKVHYAAILTERTEVSTESAPAPADVELIRPSRHRWSPAALTSALATR